MAVSASQTWGETFYNRGTKVGLTGRETHKFKIDDDLDEVTKRNKREYMHFIVSRTPYIGDINDYIITDTTSAIKNKKSKEIMYFKNLEKIEWASFLSQSLVWSIIVVFTFCFKKSVLSEPTSELGLI